MWVAKVEVEIARCGRFLNEEAGEGVFDHFKREDGGQYFGSIDVFLGAQGGGEGGMWYVT